MKKTLKNQKGFTLIELLVVVSIIAILSTVVLASLNSARDKAQSNKLQQETVQIRNALELYKNEYGTYPGVNGDYYYGWASGDGHSMNTAFPNLARFINLSSMLIGQTGIFTYLPPNSNHFYGSGYLNHNCGGVVPPQGSYMLIFAPPASPLNLEFYGWDGVTTNSYCLLSP